MRHFQLLLLAVLAVISVELGLLVIKLPTPAAQAALPNVPDPRYYGPTLNPKDLIDKFATLQQQHDQILQELAAIKKGQASLAQKMEKDRADAADSAKTILSYQRNWYRTCTAAGNLLAHLDPQAARNLNLGPDDLCQPQK